MKEVFRKEGGFPMGAFIRSMRAELLKMRHTFLLPFYGMVPLVGSVIFLAYYGLAEWSEPSRISGFAEVIGIALPLLVSIVCAGNVGLEEGNHFQVFLGNSMKKWKNLAIKFLALSGLGILAVAGGVALFGLGSYFLFGKGEIPAALYLKLAVVLALGSIPLYLEHLFLNLQFSKTVSQCVGVGQFLLSALFLTGLGEERWMFFPCTWNARGGMLVLNCAFRPEAGRIYMEEAKRAGMICLLLLLLICVIIGIWFHYYEGRQCND